MAEVSAQISPNQPAELSSGQQEVVSFTRGWRVIREHPNDYLWYSADALPSFYPRSGNISDQVADGLTGGQANREEEPKVENLREKLASSVIKLRHRVPVQDRFILLQKWEGVVTNITEDSFTARLTDLSETGPDEEAEFSLEEVPESDRKLLSPGAVFYWCIGYFDTISGQRIRGSAIRFRRLPAWTEEELATARRQAEQTRNLLGWK